MEVAYNFNQLTYITVIVEKYYVKKGLSTLSFQKAHVSIALILKNVSDLQRSTLITYFSKLNLIKKKIMLSSLLTVVSDSLETHSDL